MALVTSHVISTAGTSPTLGAAVAGDQAQTGRAYFLVVRNSHASAPRTVTLATPGNLETGDAYPDKEYTVAATGGEVWIPLLDVYRDPVTGYAEITYSDAAADLTRAVVRTP